MTVPTPRAVTAAKTAKARRMREAGRVHRLGHNVFRVDGDTAVHLVAILDVGQRTPPGGTGTVTPRWSCVTGAGPCRGMYGDDPYGLPAPEMCSHAIAVDMVLGEARQAKLLARLRADDDPFDGL